MNTKALMTKTIAIAGFTGILGGLGAGVAQAAPLPSTPVGTTRPAPATISSHVFHTVTASQTRSAGATAAKVGKSTLSTDFYNESSDTLTLTSVSGDNEGVPAVGNVLIPGQGYQDFQTVFRAAKDTTVTAVYAVTDQAGNSLGSETVKFEVDWADLGTVTLQGSLPLTVAYNSNADAVLSDAQAATIPVAAGTTEATALVNQFCNTSLSSAVCAFKGAGSPVTTSIEQLLTYDDNSANGTDADLSLAAGYDYGAGTNVGVSVSAGVNFGDVIKTGVQESFSQTVQTDHVFGSAQDQTVGAGQTGYIWGQVPVIEYNGTMQIQLGNTTWDITGFQVTAPNGQQQLSHYTSGSYAGSMPYGTSNTPPACATLCAAADPSGN